MSATPNLRCPRCKGLIAGDPALAGQQVSLGGSLETMMYNFPNWQRGRQILFVAACIAVLANLLIIHVPLNGWGMTAIVCGYIIWKSVRNAPIYKIAGLVLVFGLFLNWFILVWSIGFPGFLGFSGSIALFVGLSLYDNTGPWQGKKRHTGHPDWPCRFDLNHPWRRMSVLFSKKVLDVYEIEQVSFSRELVDQFFEVAVPFLHDFDPIRVSMRLAEDKQPDAFVSTHFDRHGRNLGRFTTKLTELRKGKRAVVEIHVLDRATKKIEVTCASAGEAGV